MNPIVNAVLISLGALFISIPLFNHFVFHTVDIDQIIMEGKDGLSVVEELQRDGKFNDSRDTALALIERFRNDSAEIFPPDVVDWGAMIKTLKNESSLGAKLVAAHIDENDFALIQSYTGAEEMSKLSEKQLLGALNDIKDDSLLYISHSGEITLPKKAFAYDLYKKCVDKGIIIEKSGQPSELKSNLTPEERRTLKMFHVAVLNDAVYEKALDKDYRRGMDWASEFIVQTAMYYIGACYKAQFQLDKATMVLDSLIILYPKSIYAEVIFLENGKAFLSEGKSEMLNGRKGIAKQRFRRAIDYLEKIEQNREIAKEFPKYKFSDLEPGKYVNVDLASKAKRRIKEKTSIYTHEQAKEDLSGENKDDKSGYHLEDAIRLVGESYIHLGITDSARSQFQLIINFFPESDNLDDAQMLIAESFIKDGDLVKEQGDTTNPETKEKAMEYYSQAIKEYQKFVNVYPQSDLIPEVFIAMGDAYNKMGMAKKSADAFASALSRAKDSEEQAKVQLKIGKYYYERQRYEEAIDAYQVILTNFLSTQVASNAQYMQGKCYEITTDTAKAVDAYQVILDIYKQSTFFGPSALKIGNWNLEWKNYPAAIEAYKTGFTYVDKESEIAAKMLLQTGMVWRKIADEKQGDDARTTTLKKDVIPVFEKVREDYLGSKESDQACYQLIEIYLEMGNEKLAREVMQDISSRETLLLTLKMFRPEDDDPGGDIAFWRQAYEDAVTDEERARALYEMAIIMTDKTEQYDEALDTYSKTIDLSEDALMDVNCKIGIARVYVAQKRYQEAQKLLVSLLQDKNVAPEVRLQLRIKLHDAYYYDKQLDKALDGFEEFAAQYPEHPLAPYAVFRAGYIYSDKGDHEKAIEKFRVVESKYPDATVFDEAVFAIGNQMMTIDSSDAGMSKTIAYYEKFLKKNPNTIVADKIYIKLGDAYTKIGKKNKALEMFKEVVDRYPDERSFSYAAYRYGMLLREKKQDDRAKAIFDLVKEEDKALFRAALAEIGKIIAPKDPEGAIEKYQRIVELCETPEDSAVAMIGIGDVYGTINKWRNAADSYDKVYDFYKGDNENVITGALVKWVNALIQSKQYRTAIKVANIMQEKYPDHQFTANTIYFEASAYLALKNFGTAHRVFKELISDGGTDQLVEIAYYQKADCMYFVKGSDKKAQMRRAIREYEEYLRKYPKGKYAARALYMQGNAYVTLEDYPNARNKLGKVVRAYPGFEEYCNAKNYYALSLNKLNQWQTALELYNEVVNRGGCNRKAVEFAKKQSEAIKASN